MSLLANIAEYLRNADSGDTSNAVRQAARRQFIHLAGPKIYRGRLPETAGPICVAIQLMDGGETYRLAGELDLAQPVVEMLVVGTDPYGAEVEEAADQLRLIFSGMNPQEIGDQWVTGATVVRHAMLTPKLFGDGSDRWSHAVALDVMFSVSQTVS